MAQRSKRKEQPNRKTADIPGSQRTSGHLFWALLIGVFGAMIGYFAAGENLAGAAVGMIAGGLLGWYLGTRMERDAGAR